MIVLPKYCCKCGEPLNENFTCDYCGEETIYPQLARKKQKKEREGPALITKYIKLLVIALFAIFAIITIIKLTNFKKSNVPDSNNLVVSVTDTPKSTMNPTLAPTVLSTPAITRIIVTDTPKSTMKSTPATSKKAKKAKKITRTPEIIIQTKEPKPIVATPNPTEAHVYADSISIPDMIVAKGSTVQLAISISPASAKYSISSSNSNIASISGKSIKGNAVGTATITVASGSKRATCRITVTNN